MVGSDGSVLHVLDVGSIHLLSGGSSVGRVLNVEERFGINGVGLNLSVELDLLISAEVLVQGLESGEGVEHLRSVSSRSLNGEGVVGEVVVCTSTVSGWESRDLVLSVLLRSSSMGKDTSSTVTGWVERGGLFEYSLVHGVVYSLAVVVTSFGAELNGGISILLSHLHVPQVQNVRVSSGSDVRFSLSPRVDISGCEVSIRASEWKIHVRALSIEYLEHSIGVKVPTDVVDETSLGGIGISRVDMNLRVGWTSEGLGSIKHGSDMLVVKNGITGLVVVVGVVNYRFELVLLDEGGVPS